MKLGIIKEDKNPPDKRVPLPPNIARQIIDGNPSLEIVAEPYDQRCYQDKEYESLGISLQKDLSDCDVILGVKEVPIERLISNKTYFFFSHTIKKQAYNRKLLLAILAKNIRLIDWECLRRCSGDRIIGFGRYAGIVGAHNGLQAFGRRTKAFSLAPAYKYPHFTDIKEDYKKLILPIFKAIITGDGRVAHGAIETFDAIGIKKVTKDEFLNLQFEEAVYVQLKNEDLYRNEATKEYIEEEYYTQPELYESTFDPFISIADLLINGIYWSPKAPAYFSLERMKQADFRIKTIADITCDIAPIASIPSTIKATVIGDPVFGYNPMTQVECLPYTIDSIDMMTIDNLPNELPRDASIDFGNHIASDIIPLLINNDSDLLDRATIAADGKLGSHYHYLQDYVDA